MECVIVYGQATERHLIFVKDVIFLGQSYYQDIKDANVCFRKSVETSEP